MTISDYHPFRREVIDTLPCEERRELLATLEDQLTERLKNHAAGEDYWREVHRIIAELKSTGHDLWSHDYDGGKRWVWGWNYGHQEGAGDLRIRFEQGGPVRTSWRTESSLIGTVDGGGLVDDADLSHPPAAGCI